MHLVRKLVFDFFPEFVRRICTWSFFLEQFWKVFLRTLGINPRNVPTFEENGIVLLGVIFLFSQFSGIEIIAFSKHFINHWRYRLPEINFKKITSDLFLQSYGVWKLPFWPYSGLIYARYQDFNNNAESVIFMHGEFLCTTKSFQI